VFRVLHNLYGSGKNAETHSEDCVQFLQEALRTHAVYEGDLQIDSNRDKASFMKAISGAVA
jgi:hypothetical protein